MLKTIAIFLLSLAGLIGLLEGAHAVSALRVKPNPSIVVGAVNEHRDHAAIVASRAGHVYHRAGCSSAMAIKSPLEFASADDAKKAGLRPCRNCFAEFNP